MPADWNSADNSVETIGGGGGGGTSSGGNDAGGGGGGAYSKIHNLALTPGAIVTIQIGAGGFANAAGGDTWFNGASLAASSVGAKGGGGAAGPIGGAGGDQAAGIGTLKYSGGNGGSSTNSQNGGAGGGGAGGPNGPGRAGALSAANVGSGGGGAGGASSTAGSDGSGATGGIGGDGPEGHAAAPGGTGAISGTSNAITGVRGSGGGGGAVGGIAGQAAGAPGGNGIEFDAVHGAGGGGGGGGYQYASNAHGGAGGYFGGGGGGTGFAPGTGVGGSGAQGVIVVNFDAAALVTADAPVSSETVASRSAKGLPAIQFMSSMKADCPLPGATERWIRQGLMNPVEDIALACGSSVDMAEFSSAAAGPDEASLPLETAAAVRRQTDFEPAFEHLAAVISPFPRFPAETAGPVDLPRISPVSPGRLLRSPGRVRTLAGPGSRLPLRGQ